MALRPVLTVAAAALPLLVAACSSADDTAGSGATVDPCSLLTLEEVAAAIGRPVADGQEDIAPAGPYCTWESTDPPSEGLESAIKLTLFIGPFEGDDRAGIEAMAADPTENVVVEGLGDLAVAHCSFGETDKCDEIYVAVGDRYLQLNMGNYAWPGDYQESELIGIVTTLARHAVPRLP